MKHRRTLCACAGSVSRSAKRPRHTSSCCCGPLHTCTHIIPIKCFHEYIIINNGSKYSQVLLSILNYFLFTFFLVLLNTFIDLRSQVSDKLKRNVEEKKRERRDREIASSKPDLNSWTSRAKHVNMH